MKQVLFVCAIFLQLLTEIIADTSLMSVSANPSQVGMNSTLLIQISATELIEKGGIIVIEIPKASQMSDEIACEVLEPKDMGLDVCKYHHQDRDKSFLIVLNDTIEATFDQKATIFLQIGINQRQLGIDTFKNPPSTYFPQSFQLYLYAKNTTLLEQQLNGIYLLGLTPKPLSRGQLRLGSNVIGQKNSSISILFVASNESLQDGVKVLIQMPWWNEEAQNPQSYIDEDDLKCELWEEEVECSIVNEKDLEIRNLNETQTVEGQRIEIVVYGFQNPIQYGPVDGFKITTIDENGGKIEQSESLTISATKPMSFSYLRLSIDSGSSTVQEFSTLRLDFAQPFPLNQGCQIVVQFPSQFSKLNKYLDRISTFGLFGALQDLDFSYSRTNNTLTLVHACSTYLDNSMDATLKFSKLQNPAATGEASPLTFSILDSAGNSLVRSDQSFPANFFLPGEITLVNFTVDNDVVQESTGLWVTFNSKSSLSLLGRIKIVIPMFNFTFSLSNNCTIENLSWKIKDITVTCTFDGSLVVDIFGFEGWEGGKEITFSLGNLFTNPDAALTDIGEFKVQTFEEVNGELQLVDEGTVKNPFKIKQGKVQNIQIELDSSQNELTLSFDSQHKIPKGGNLVIQLPEDISVKASQFDCQDLEGFPSTPVCSYSKGFVTVEDGFKSLFGRNQRLSLKLKGLGLPRWIGAERVVRFYTTDKNMLVVDDGEQEVVDENKYITWQLWSESEINFDITSYFVQFKANVDFEYKDQLALKLPEELTIDPITFNCDVNGEQSPCTFEKEENLLVIKSRGNFVNQQKNIIELKNIRNPNSTREIGPFQLGLTDSESRFLVKTKDNQTISTSIPQPLIGVILNQSNTNPNQRANYSFNILPNIQDYQALFLKFSSCVTFDNVSSLEFNDNFFTYNVFEDSLTILGFGVNKFTLLNVINPNEECFESANSSNISISFSITTYEDMKLEFPMESQENSIVPSLQCSTACQTCDYLIKDYCLSCTPPLSSLKGFCFEKCPVGYLSVEGSCLPCPTGCQNCSQIGMCNKCSQEFYYYQGTCIDVCPLRSYLKKEECVPCSSNCYTCKASEDSCLTCPKDLYLVEDSCVEQCPEGFSAVLEGMECVQEEVKNYFRSAVVTVAETIYYYPIVCLFGLFVVICFANLIMLKDYFKFCKQLLSFAAISESISYYYYAYISSSFFEPSLSNYLHLVSPLVNIFTSICLSTIFSILFLQGTNFAQVNLSYSVPENIMNWRNRYGKTSWILCGLALLFQLHVFQLLNSGFFKIQSLQDDLFKNIVEIGNAYVKCGYLLIVVRGAGIGINIYLYLQNIEEDKLRSTLIENVALALLVIALQYLVVLIERRLQRRNQTVNKESKYNQCNEKSNVTYKSENTINFSKKVEVQKINLFPRTSFEHVSHLENILNSEFYSEKPKMIDKQNEFLYEERKEASLDDIHCNFPKQFENQSFDSAIIEESKGTESFDVTQQESFDAPISGKTSKPFKRHKSLRVSTKKQSLKMDIGQVPISTKHQMRPITIGQIAMLRNHISFGLRTTQNAIGNLLTRLSGKRLHPSLVKIDVEETQ